VSAVGPANPISPIPVVHWDDVRSRRAEQGHIAGTWQNLTGRASRTVGVKRIQVDAGMWATPLHLEGAEEEIFYVLDGSGVSVQWEGEDTMGYAVREGDCIVHLPLENAHTLRAGDDGLDVLAFGERVYAGGVGWIPRAGVAWLGETWGRVGAEEDHPWKREADAGPPDFGELRDRPSNIVHVDAVAEFERAGATVSRRGRDLGRAAGSQRTGIKVYDVAPGLLMNPPHCHSAEEEIFVVLEGTGTLTVWPHLRSEAEPERFPAESEEHELRRGHVVASVAGSGRPLELRAGAQGMRVLAYGTRDPNDITYYPRSGKVMLRGVGVIGRLEQADYWEGEE
jgi:uncharacterized cupin superfamily protein